MHDHSAKFQTAPETPLLDSGLPSERTLLDALLAQTTDSVMLVDVTGRVLFANQDLPGLDGEEPHGDALPELFAPRSQVVCRDAIERCCRRGQTGSFDALRRDGVWWSVRLAPVHGHATAAALVIATDVSERRRTAQALQESEQRFRQLAENVREVFWLMEFSTRRVLYVTNAYGRVWGRAAQELYDGTQGWFDAVHADDRQRVERAFAAALDEDGYQVEYRIERPDGSVRWIRERGFPQRAADAASKPRIAGIAEDITEQKSIEDTLRLERKLLKRLLDLQERERHLLACEIHDGFIQDLVGAKMLLESVHSRLGEEHDLSEQLSTIEYSLRKAIGEGRRMISNLRPMVIDDNGILAAIEYLINERQVEPGPRMTFSHNVRFARLPPLLEGALFRIVQESLNNARRHSRAQNVSITLAQHGERVVLTITDDGVGFDRASVPEGRFGLRGLVERARLFGGRAEVRSQPGEGTTIWVDLPISKSGISA